MQKDVVCPMCGKVIGKRVYEGTVNLGGFGADMCREKLDYRKASHVWWHARGKGGTLCRACAIKVFPDRKRWRVRYMEHGKEWCLFGGVNGSEDFASNQEAQAVCERHNANYGQRCWVTEHSI